MKLRIYLASIFVSIMLSGCVTTDEEVDYENNTITPPLEIPPDLISRSQKDQPATGKY